MHAFGVFELEVVEKLASVRFEMLSEKQPFDVQPGGSAAAARIVQLRGSAVAKRMEAIAISGETQEGLERTFEGDVGSNCNESGL
jgi:hypothetical protein